MIKAANNMFSKILNGYLRKHSSMLSRRKRYELKISWFSKFKYFPYGPINRHSESIYIIQTKLNFNNKKNCMTQLMKIYLYQIF